MKIELFNLLSKYNYRVFFQFTKIKIISCTINILGTLHILIIFYILSVVIKYFYLLYEFIKVRQGNLFSWHFLEKV